MNAERRRKIEFGDFQTPETLALELCTRLASTGLKPKAIVEPTCGLGALLLAAAKTFPEAETVLGYDVNPLYIEALSDKISGAIKDRSKFNLEVSDFFSTDWNSKLENTDEPLLVVGNYPWVTNTAQNIIGGENLPKKSNFLNLTGFDAISGKSNFDISESMLIETLSWFNKRNGTIAMIIKSSVARKVIAFCEKSKIHITNASITKINAKSEFGVSVDACFLTMTVCHAQKSNYDYTIYESIKDQIGSKVGHRLGLTVGDLDKFSDSSFLIGNSPQKWRSGLKHDAAAVMELTQIDGDLYKNGLNELVKIEPLFTYPLLKGSDIGSNKDWRQKFVIVTQKAVGAPTQTIREFAPLTWNYLLCHSHALDKRSSKIYEKNPRFSVFGIGDYAFKPWKIAICGLYKSLRYRLVGPIGGQPVMFDDTVYYLSFNTEDEARNVLSKIESEQVSNLLKSLIFWDEKRPIKTSILNQVDWSRLDFETANQPMLI